MNSATSPCAVFRNEWAVGFEHYAGFGRINKMPNSSQQDQVLYFAADFERKGFGVNFGIGKGLSNASDDWVVKAIVSIPPEMVNRAVVGRRNVNYS